MAEQAPGRGSDDEIDSGKMSDRGKNLEGHGMPEQTVRKDNQRAGSSRAR